MKEKETKCSLKTTEVLLDAAGTFAYLSLIFVKVSCFKGHTIPCCPNASQKKVLSNVWSEIHLDRHNIVSSGQYVWASKKYIFRFAFSNFSSIHPKMCNGNNT